MIEDTKKRLDKATSAAITEVVATASETSKEGADVAAIGEASASTTVEEEEKDDADEEVDPVVQGKIKDRAERFLKALAAKGV